MLRAFKLLQAATVFISDPNEKPARAKTIQYVNLEADARVWAGWEFTETDRGIEIRPPNRADEALAPWSQVVFLNRRPEAKKVSK